MILPNSVSYSWNLHNVLTNLVRKDLIFCQLKRQSEVSSLIYSSILDFIVLNSAAGTQQVLPQCMVLVQVISGDKYSTDWDKAWKSFRKQGKKKSLFSQFSPNKYVSWNPRRSNYPLSEEVDPIKRTERSNLMLWTSPRFTLAGAIVLVTFLLVYTILAPIK